MYREWKKLYIISFQGMCENSENGGRHYEFIWWRNIKQVCGGGSDGWFEEMEWKIGDLLGFGRIGG